MLVIMSSAAHVLCHSVNHTFSAAGACYAISLRCAVACKQSCWAGTDLFKRFGWPGAIESVSDEKRAEGSRCENEVSDWFGSLSVQDNISEKKYCPKCSLMTQG